MDTQGIRPVCPVCQDTHGGLLTRSVCKTMHYAVIDSWVTYRSYLGAGVANEISPLPRRKISCTMALPSYPNRRNGIN